jgi:hypothetical protein
MWELDEFGRPAWLVGYRDAEWGRWEAVIPSAEAASAARLDVSSPEVKRALEGGPACMPSMGARLARRLRPDERSRPAVGRPPIECSDPLVARWAAWVTDIREVSIWEIARRRSPWAFARARRDKREPPPNKRSARRPAERRVGAGRSILNRVGVLPWVLWEGGDLPVGWWADARFSEGLRVWYDVYVSRLQPAITAAKETLERGETSDAAVVAWQGAAVATLRQQLRASSP